MPDAYWIRTLKRLVGQVVKVHYEGAGGGGVLEGKLAPLTLADRLVLVHPTAVGDPGVAMKFSAVRKVEVA